MVLNQWMKKISAVLCVPCTIMSPLNNVKNSHSTHSTPARDSYGIVKLNVWFRFKLNHALSIWNIILHQTRLMMVPECLWLFARICMLFYNPVVHYNDVILSAMASQITSSTIVCSTVYSGADQRKHQSSASLAFVRGNHRRPVNSPHKRPVTPKMFPFDEVIMYVLLCHLCS